MKYISFVLAIVCTVVFGLQLAMPMVTDLFVLESSRVLINPWILVTSIFLHESVSHLVFNMFALLLFGFILENIIGTRKFLFLFFAGGICAGIASAVFYQASLGASGAIFAVIGCLAVLRPKMIVWAIGVPMPMFIAAIFWALIDLAGIFYPSNVANAAHLGGLIFGVIFASIVRKNYKQHKEKEKNVLNKKQISDWENDYL